MALGLCATGVSEAQAAAETQVLDRDVFLHAIAEVETGGNPRAVGTRGERGLYQFGRMTWGQYTKRSFQDAHDPSIARGVAEKHYDWLHASFVQKGRKPTPYLMAAAWNAGLTRTLTGRLPSSTRDYARRVSNVFASLNRPKPAPAVAPPAVQVAAPDTPQPPRLFVLGTQ